MELLQHYWMQRIKKLLLTCVTWSFRAHFVTLKIPQIAYADCTKCLGLVTTPLRIVLSEGCLATSPVSLYASFGYLQ